MTKERATHHSRLNIEREQGVMNDEGKSNSLFTIHHSPFTIHHSPPNIEQGIMKDEGFMKTFGLYLTDEH
ncbi:hypothetical protein [Foetidibacter luteolus]|uniref:hypothetical protein n=1 Tax=Foetidibacter luteolus TaxID=2608880 RepID=UPI00129C093C|nr:hypothetical protein [Foetidibacter luteolus]